MSASDDSEVEVVEVRRPNRSSARDVLEARPVRPAERVCHPASYNRVDYRQLAIDDGFIFPTNGWYPCEGNCPKCFRIGSFEAGHSTEHLKPRGENETFRCEKCNVPNVLFGVEADGNVDVFNPRFISRLHFATGSISWTRSDAVCDVLIPGMVVKPWKPDRHRFHRWFRNILKEKPGFLTMLKELSRGAWDSFYEPWAGSCPYVEHLKILTLP